MSYSKIEDHAIIGDLNTVALVALNGTIDFMCFPYFDSPSIFTYLLDENKGGSFQIKPKEENYNSKQIYLGDTNVLSTSFMWSDGIGEIVDFMPVAENDGHTLIRKVTAKGKNIVFDLCCDPKFDYARNESKVKEENGEIIFESPEENGISIKLISDVKLKIKDDGARTQFELKDQDSAYFIFQLLEENKSIDCGIEEYAESKLNETVSYWRRWIDQSNYNGRWKNIVNRSALTLKLMTSAKYGSMVAAPTFGLPVDIGGERNFDYRFTWIRDTSFMLFAFINLGYDEEAKRFIDWFDKHCEGVGKDGQIKLVYGLNGSKAADEINLDHLEGYKKSKPVRIGNNATNQEQLDIYGELIDAMYIYDKFGEPISHELWENISTHLNWLSENWQKKDAGIWEYRKQNYDFLISKLMCWVAFDRGIKIAGHRSFPTPNNWIEERDKIYNYIFDNYWNEEEKSFVQYKGADNVDGSILLMPIMRFISPFDPMWKSTMAKIEKDLVSDFLVYRYNPKDAPDDGFTGTEGTFNVCTFWYIENLARGGRLEEARLKFEKIISLANHVGLFSEQLDLSGIHLGNFPQGYTHLGLISTAMSLRRRISRDEKDFKIVN